MAAPTNQRGDGSSQGPRASEVPKVQAPFRCSRVRPKARVGLHRGEGHIARERACGQGQVYPGRERGERRALRVEVVRGGELHAAHPCVGMMASPKSAAQAARATFPMVLQVRGATARGVPPPPVRGAKGAHFGSRPARENQPIAQLGLVRYIVPVRAGARVVMARFFHEDLGPSWVLSLYLAVAVE